MILGLVLAQSRHKAEFSNEEAMRVHIAKDFRDFGKRGRG